MIDGARTVQRSIRRRPRARAARAVRHRRPPGRARTRRDERRRVLRAPERRRRCGSAGSAACSATRSRRRSTASRQPNRVARLVPAAGGRAAQPARRAPRSCERARAVPAGHRRRLDLLAAVPASACPALAVGSVLLLARAAAGLPRAGSARARRVRLIGFGCAASFALITPIFQTPGRERALRRRAVRGRDRRSQRSRRAAGPQRRTRREEALALEAVNLFATIESAARPRRRGARPTSDAWQRARRSATTPSRTTTAAASRSATSVALAALLRARSRPPTWRSRAALASPTPADRDAADVVR